MARSAAAETSGVTRSPKSRIALSQRIVSGITRLASPQAGPGLAALEVPAAWPADDSKDSAKSVAQNSSQRQAAPELAELRSLKDQIEGMRAEYEKRIKELEARLEDLQAQMLRSLPEPSAA